MNFLNGAFPVGRLFDITIRVHVLFLFYIGWRVYDALREGAGWQGELLFLALLFGIVLLHEFGHCFGARAVGGEAHDILMWPLGGLAYARAPMRPWPQFVTVAAGPAVNLLFCLISGAIVWGYTQSWRLIALNPYAGLLLPRDMNWIAATWVFYQVNLMLLAFNLLPIYPLDGGQLFHAILWPSFGLQRATMIACQVGIVGCVIFAILSFKSGGGMLFFIALFGGMTCWQRLQAARNGLLYEDPVYQNYGAAPRRSLWSRLFGRRARQGSAGHPVEFPNPNPGGWDAKLQRDRELEEELDRILKKVSAEGIQSLSYLERQRLEWITRERQREEQELDRRSRH